MIRAKAELGQTNDVVGAGLGGIGEHGHLAAALTEATQGFGGVRIGDGAVVERAELVYQQGAVLAGDFGQAGDGG